VLVKILAVCSVLSIIYLHQTRQHAQVVILNGLMNICSKKCPKYL